MIGETVQWVLSAEIPSHYYHIGRWVFACMGATWNTRERETRKTKNWSRAWEKKYRCWNGCAHSRLQLLSIVKFIHSYTRCRRFFFSSFIWNATAYTFSSHRSAVLMVCELNQQNPPTDQEVYVRFVRRVAGSYSSTVISERLRVKWNQRGKKNIKENNKSTSTKILNVSRKSHQNTKIAFNNLCFTTF